MRRLSLAVLLSASACAAQVDEAAYYQVRDVGLDLPRVEGWRRDRAAEVKQPDRGGVVFRLVRDQAVTGSPRIDVVVAAKGGEPASLEAFVARNLEEIASLGRNGTLRVTDLDKQPIAIGPRRGVRVRHEYILTAGQAAITQVSVFLILDGHGVTVSAVGRTELFLPLAAHIEAILSGLRVPILGARPQEIGSNDAAPDTPALLRPIDLGKVGGH